MELYCQVNCNRSRLVDKTEESVPDSFRSVHGVGNLFEEMGPFVIHISNSCADCIGYFVNEALITEALSPIGIPIMNS